MSGSWSSEIGSIRVSNLPDQEVWKEAQAFVAGFDPERMSLEDLGVSIVAENNDPNLYITDGDDHVLACLAAIHGANTIVHFTRETLSPAEMKALVDAADEVREYGVRTVMNLAAQCLAGFDYNPDIPGSDSAVFSADFSGPDSPVASLTELDDLTTDLTVFDINLDQSAN